MRRKVLCPICGKWLFTIEDKTKGTIYVWCRYCRKEIRINIKEPLSR